MIDKEFYFEIINKYELPKDCVGKVLWGSIEPGFVFKTNHSKYGYNEFEYIKYKKMKLYLKYNNKDVNINYGSFSKGIIGGIIGKRTNKFKYDVGTVFDSITIIDKEYRLEKSNNQNVKWYKYKCSKCGWNDGWITESRISSGGRCSCCHGKTTVYGINSICDTDMYLVDEFGLDLEFAKTNSRGTNNKGLFTCMFCGYKRKVSPNYVIKNKKVPCSCGDSYSFGEKFMMSILNQLGVKYITELSKSIFKWCKNYRYDFYIPERDLIIEIHGKQHYKEVGRGRSLIDEELNDLSKSILAYENGIKKYIVIDAMKSELNWIKDSIIKSEFSDIYNISNINWEQALEYSCSNILKEVCTYWKNRSNNESTTDLMNVFHISRTTIIRYLKRGVELGWCEYDPKEEYIKGTRTKTNGKEVEIFKDGVSLGIFESASELSRRSIELFGVKLDSKNISSVCLGKSSHHKKYTFKYIKNK